MTNEEKFNKAVDKRIQTLDSLNAESTQIQLALEYAETIKTENCMKWLLSVADERQNKKLHDTITLLDKRFKKHKKLISDLQYYEHKAFYFEMMYNSTKINEKTVDIVKNFMVEKGL